VLFSGGVDEFSLSNEVYATIIPAFVTALLPLKPRYPYPPDPQVYEGTYMLAQLSTLKIVTYEQQLLLTISSQGAVTQSVYLAYKEPLQLQVKTASFHILPTALLAQGRICSKCTVSCATTSVINIAAINICFTLFKDMTSYS